MRYSPQFTSWFLIAPVLHGVILYFSGHPWLPIAFIVLAGVFFDLKNVSKRIIWAAALAFLYLMPDQFHRYQVFQHGYLPVLLLMPLLSDPEKDRFLILYSNCMALCYLAAGPGYMNLLISLIAAAMIYRAGIGHSRSLFRNPLSYLIVIMILWNFSLVPGSASSCRIGFDTDHSNLESADSLFNSTLDIESTTGHGGLVRFLKKLHPVKIVEELSFSEKLSQSDIMFIILPTVPFTKAEKSHFNDFILHGGKAVLVGEHDNMNNSSAVLNDLLSNTSIRFQNDIVWISDKNKDLSLAFHPLFLRSQLHYKTGCSITGLHEVMIYGPDRVPLGGTYALGTGKIFCLGDSSLFQNSTFFYHYDFVMDLIKYLHFFAPPVSTAKVILLIPFILAVLLVLFRQGFSTDRPYAVIHQMQYLIIFGLLLVWLNGYLFFSTNDSMYTDQNRYVFFDFSRNSLRTTVRETDSFSENNLDAIIAFTQLSEYLPSIKFRFSELFSKDHQPAFIVSIAPGIPYSISEIRQLRNFIEKGGNFILASGVDTIHNMSGVLESFEIGFSSRPVLWKEAGVKDSPLISIIRPGIKALSCTDSPDQYCFNPCSVKNADPLLIIDNFVVAANKPYGKGTLHIFCDDSFFSNGLTSDLKKVVDDNKIQYFLGFLNKMKND